MPARLLLANRKLFIALFLLLVLPLSAASSPFDKNTLASLEQTYKGQSWLLVLWSVDCAPCHMELDLIAAMVQKNKNLRVELVATDPPENQRAVEQRINTSNLASWQFASNNDAAIRYAIDSNWRGEQPRNYFYQANGQRCAKSGALTAQQIEGWFAKQQVSCGVLD